MTDAKPIKYSFWLRFSRSGSVHCSKNPPPLGVDERAMKVAVDIPATLFTRPQLAATITVPEMPQQPLTFDIDAAETALSEIVGASVMISVVDPAPVDAR